MATKTAGTGDHPYKQNDGVRPYKGNMTSEANRPVVPEPTNAPDRDIHAVHQPSVGKHPALGIQTGGDTGES